MSAFLKKFFLWLLLVVLAAVGFFYILAQDTPPESVSYGVTFSKFRTDELNLPWEETYRAILNDLEVKHLRLVAHWPMVEPQEDQFDFSVLDQQMRLAEAYDAKVVLAIGRRLPSWPECHEPEWVRSLSETEKRSEQLEYMEAVVNRYKDSPALAMWQVENEPFIIGFAYENCGSTDANFLEAEIALVKSLDPVHPVMLTASGELGFWNRTWSRADVFGTTLYRRVWNRDLNTFITYPTSPAFFRAKKRLTELMEGERPVVISELAAEPWPVKAIIETSLEDQLARMDIAFFEDTIRFAYKTGFETQYFWGAEWWYYLKEAHEYPQFWDRAKELF